MSRINKNYLNGDYVIDKMYHQNKNSERLIKNKPTLQSFELQTSASVNEDDGGEYNIYFGNCTSFANESRLVIGARSKNIFDGTNDAGMVFIFDSSSAQGWTQTTGVYAPNPAGNQHFGEVVAAEGNYLIASAPSRTVSGTLNVGEVFIYQYVEWSKRYYPPAKRRVKIKSGKAWQSIYHMLPSEPLVDTQIQGQCGFTKVAVLAGKFNKL